MERGIYYTHHDSDHYVKLVGELRFNQSQALEQLIQTIENEDESLNLKLDLTETKFLDSTILGLIGRMGLHFNNAPHERPMIFCPQNDIRKNIEIMGLQQLFDIDDQTIEVDQLQVVTVDSEDKESLRERVIKSHEFLIKIDKKNQEQFDTLINRLKRKDRSSDE